MQSFHRVLSSAYSFCRNSTELGPFHPGLPFLTPCHPPGYLIPGLLLIPQSSSQRPLLWRASLLLCQLLLAPDMLGLCPTGFQRTGGVSCLSSLNGNWHVVGVLLAKACYIDLYGKTYFFAPLPLVPKVPPGLQADMGDAEVRYRDNQGGTSDPHRGMVRGQARGLWVRRCYWANRKPAGRGLSNLRSQRQKHSMPFAEMN